MESETGRKKTEKKTNELLERSGWTGHENNGSDRERYWNLKTEIFKKTYRIWVSLSNNEWDIFILKHQKGKTKYNENHISIFNVMCCVNDLILLGTVI